jgi:hypothetical protein
MIAKIADVVFRSREVEIPDNCPHCGAELETELMVCRYDYAFFMGNKDGTPRSNDDDEYGDFPGEGPPLGFFCGQCSEAIVYGKEKTITSHDVSRIAEETIWSHAVDCLILEDG